MKKNHLFSFSLYWFWSRFVQFWCFSEVLGKSRNPKWRIQDGRHLAIRRPEDPNHTRNENSEACLLPSYVLISTYRNCTTVLEAIMELTNKNLPEVSNRCRDLIVIAFPSVLNISDPVISTMNHYGMVIQFTFPLKPPFTNKNFVIFRSPFCTLTWKVRVVSFQSFKRSTGSWFGFRLSGEVLNNSFSSAVSDGDHVKRTSSYFTAVKPHLSERQVLSQVVNGGICENQIVALVTVDLAIWRLKR